MRPAGLRSPNPFVRSKGRPGGQKLGLDLDRIGSSNNHNARLFKTIEELKELRHSLHQAEAGGRWSKAKKLRRYINEHLEVELYLRHSWCGGCQNVLHNCRCRAN